MPQTFRTIVPRAIIVALVSIASTVAAPASRATDADTSVHVETPLGAFDIRLFPGSAPITVANFLEYVNDGDYENSFVHRKVSGFVIQGGGFVFNNNATISVVRARAPIPNEFSLSNLRGTIAMAKVGGDPNSATSQWFINLSDNGDTLDSDNGGYAVFGEVGDITGSCGWEEKERRRNLRWDHQQPAAGCGGREGDATRAQDYRWIGRGGRTADTGRR